jgi:3-oxoacyl-[acyl-carrier protein] reductase
MTAPVRRMAVVTGGAGAIGGSVAAALTAAGHQVLILDRTGDVPVDLADEQQVRAAAQRAFVPGMAARGFGRIIVVVSDTVWAPPAADLLPYVTSKGALVALARALAMAHGPDGIVVTCWPPG